MIKNKLLPLLLCVLVLLNLGYLYVKIVPGKDVEIVIVDWCIKKDRIEEFLNYWSEKATIPDRSKLIGEFMTTKDAQVNYPWINWDLPQDCAQFYNVALWEKGGFQEQIGKNIDNNRPPLDFEYEKRTRIVLTPMRWRIGNSLFPVLNFQGIK